MAITYGSEYQFNDAGSDFADVALLDSTHIVVTYQDATTSDAYAIIGVISGSTITYGDPYLINDVDTSTEIVVCALDSTHFAVVYGRSWLKAKIGVVSNGDEIAFGTEADVASEAPWYDDVVAIDSTHFAVVWDADASGKSVIGTVASGDAITFGTTYTFEAHDTRYVSVGLLDSTHIVVTYKDDTDVVGSAIVGVISSGDVITYGTSVDFIASSTAYTTVNCLDSTHFVVGYRNIGSTNRGEAVVGTVASGDEISFGSAVVYDTYHAPYSSIAILDSTHFTIAFADDSNSDYGSTIVGTVASGDEITFGTASAYGNETDTYNRSVGIDSTHIAIAFNANGTGESFIGTLVADTLIKSLNGLAIASVKSKNGLAKADIKSFNGLA